MKRKSPKKKPRRKEPLNGKMQIPCLVSKYIELTRNVQKQKPKQTHPPRERERERMSFSNTQRER